VTRRGSSGALARAGSPPELGAAAIGALLVCGAIGWLLHEAITSDGSAPVIVLEVDSVLPRGDGFLVEFSATNRGETTAASLRIEGELLSDTVRIERSEASLDFVPAGATRHAGMLFDHDPRLFHLRLRPRGYHRP
jgi:uncharacterized protein (TIGR02588 family)